jgi:hypothetical protein
MCILQKSDMIKQSIYVYCSNGQWQLLLLNTSKYRYVGICITQLLMEFHKWPWKWKWWIHQQWKLRHMFQQLIMTYITSHKQPSYVLKCALFYKTEFAINIHQTQKIFRFSLEFANIILHNAVHFNHILISANHNSLHNI